jgi:GPH family glycoside/pentoside/hexuronide:cation symporter
VFSLIGVLLALGAGPIVIDSLGYAGMAGIFGAVVFVSFMISLLGSKEDPANREEDNIPFWTGVKIAFANSSFRWFVGANIAKEFIFLITVAMVPFWAKYALQLKNIQGGMDAATQEALLLAVPFIVAIPAMAVWTRITQRYGSTRAWIYTSYAMLPGFLIMFIAPNFTMGLIGTGLLVLGLPGLLMLYNVVLSDIIDEDEMISGRRREGFYFGINGALIRLAFSVQAVLLGLVFQITGFSSDLVSQPVSAVWGIRFLMAGTPMIACAVTVWALHHYPLQGERLHEMREQLAQRRRKATGLAES